MSEIYFAPYELRSKQTLGKSAGAIRKGALLQFKFSDDGRGYADCHPWPELGDAPLDQQLSLLRVARLTPLTARSLFFAKQDAVYRAEKRSAFKNLPSPESHLLFGNALELKPGKLRELKALGWTCIKLKAGGEPEREGAHLSQLAQAAQDEGLKLRIDLNQRLDFEIAKRFLDAIFKNAASIEFVEDPVPYQSSHWLQLQGQFGIPLALDRLSEPSVLDSALSSQACAFIVVKPAIQNFDEIAKIATGTKIRLVITTYLDHPLGASCAAWTAAQALTTAPKSLALSGLMSHLNFETNPFSERIRNAGPRWIHSEGTGWGFDEELGVLNWQELR